MIVCLYALLIHSAPWHERPHWDERFAKLYSFRGHVLLGLSNHVFCSIVATVLKKNAGTSHVVLVSKANSWQHTALYKGLFVYWFLTPTPFKTKLILAVFWQTCTQNIHKTYCNRHYQKCVVSLRFCRARDRGSTILSILDADSVHLSSLTDSPPSHLTASLGP